MSSSEGNQSTLPPLALGAVVTRERFAEASGLTEETIRGMVNRGYLPSVLIGRHRMINVVALTKHLSSLEFDV